MYYVYVLKSLKDKDFYVGSTKDIKERILQHTRGYVKSTRDRRPLKLVYCEISNNIKDAIHREKYLKTSWGKRYLKNRLKMTINKSLSNGVLVFAAKFYSLLTSSKI